MDPITPVYLLLGSNITPRSSYLAEAEKLIGEQVGEVIGHSRVYESEAWGFEAATAFLNRMIVVATKEPPEKVLKNILAIENSLGRTRKEGGYASRTIDIDIIYYGDSVIDQEKLTIPHPGIAFRNFVLKPLVEMAPDFVHPLLKLTNSELLERSEDKVKVWVYE